MGIVMYLLPKVVGAVACATPQKVLARYGRDLSINQPCHTHPIDFKLLDSIGALAPFLDSISGKQK